MIRRHFGILVICLAVATAGCGASKQSFSRDTSNNRNQLTQGSVSGSVTEFPTLTSIDIPNLQGPLGASCSATTCIAWGNRQQMINNGDGTLTARIRPTLYNKSNGIWVEVVPPTAYGGSNDDHNLAYATNGACSSNGNCLVFGMRAGAVFCSDRVQCPAENAYYLPTFYTYSAAAGFSPSPTGITPGLVGDADPNSGMYFISSSCREDTCFAVGRYFTQSPRMEAPVVLSATSAGGNVQLTRIVLPAGRQLKNSGSQKISCNVNNRCAVVGLMDNNSPFIAQLVGGVWKPASAVALPSGVAADGNTTAVDVACASDGSCDAVGNYAVSKTWTAHVDSAGVIGTSLQLPVAANITPTSATVSGVRCPTAGACVAAGSITFTTPCKVWAYQSGWKLTTVTCTLNRGFGAAQVNGTWGTPTLIAEPDAKFSDAALLDGSTLKVPDSNTNTYGGVAPVFGKNYLTSLECTSATMCLTVGYFFTAGATASTPKGNGVTQAVFDSGSWTSASKMVQPSIGAFNQMGVMGLGCTTDSTCIAYGNQDTVGHTYIADLTLLPGGAAPEATTNIKTPTSTATSSSVTTAPGVADNSATVINPPATNPTSNTPPVTPAVQISVGKTLSSQSVAAAAKLAVSAGSKVAVTISSASKAVCKMSGTRLSALKAGTCRLSVRVTPLKGKAISKSLSLTIKK